MEKKRLVINLNPADYAVLVGLARDANTNISNFVRRKVGLPEERQGVKRPDDPPKKARRVKTPR
jgi:hypothetical protein